MTATKLAASRRNSKKSSKKPRPKKAKSRGNGAPAPEPVAQAKPASISPEHAAYLERRKEEGRVLLHYPRLALGLDSEHEDGVDLHTLIRTMASGGQGSTKEVPRGASKYGKVKHLGGEDEGRHYPHQRDMLLTQLSGRCFKPITNASGRYHSGGGSRCQTDKTIRDMHLKLPL